MYSDILPLKKVDDYENPIIKYHFINPETGWEWWVCAGEKISEDDFYFFGIAKITEVEMGFFTLNQIKSYGAVLDNEWVANRGLYDVLNQS